MTFADLLGHLFPPFDAWWPNIIAALVWAPAAFAAQHVSLRRMHRRHIDQQTEEILDAVPQQTTAPTAPTIVIGGGAP